MLDLKAGGAAGGGLSVTAGSRFGGIGQAPPPSDASDSLPSSSADKRRRKAIAEPVKGDLGPSRFKGPPPEDGRKGAVDHLIAESARLQPPERQTVTGKTPGRYELRLNARVSLPPMESDPQRNPSADYIHSAKIKTGLGDNAGAIADATKAIAEDPANPEGYVRRAEASNNLKRYGDAERDALVAIQIAPNYAGGYLNRGWALFHQKRYAEAVEAASRAIALHDDSISRLTRGYAKEALGDRASALSDLEAAAALDPRLSGKLEAARSGGKIYDPDQESMLRSAAAGSTGRSSDWPMAALAGGILVAAGAAAVFFRRRRAEGRALAGASASAAQKSVEGRLAGKYEVLRVIGRGGMGTVYEAVDHTLGRSVAIKKVSEEFAEIGARAREMLLKEARTVASLHHPAIVEIYEIFEEGSDFYVVFELVTGKTAAQILAERGRLSLRDCLGILRPVCEALDFAHGRSLVHRDLKPANIMVTELGRVKLMDFGIARSVADAAPAEGQASSQPAQAWLARTRTVVGTPAYMAPEAEQGLISKAADIYALGVCLYEFSTGRQPFSAQAAVSERLSARVAPPSRLDPALASIDALVLSALDPSPAARPASAGAFIAALDAAARRSAAPPASGPAQL